MIEMTTFDSPAQLSRRAAYLTSLLCIRCDRLLQAYLGKVARLVRSGGTLGMKMEVSLSDLAASQHRKRH